LWGVEWAIFVLSVHWILIAYSPVTDWWREWPTLAGREQGARLGFQLAHFFGQYP
jgi:hypothetical protein